MKVSVASRAHRNLRKLKGYKVCNSWNLLAQYIKLPNPLSPDEKLVGVYENKPRCLDQIILFSDLAVHLWECSKWKCLKYADMAGSEWPNESKSEADALIIRMTSGDFENLPVLGGTEFTRDVFSVMTFLDRVIADSERAVD